jgi:hypothetical protein
MGTTVGQTGHLMTDGFGDLVRIAPWRHAIHVEATAAAGPAQAWVDTKGAPARADELAGTRLTNSTNLGDMGGERIGASVINNPLYVP